MSVVRGRNGWRDKTMEARSRRSALALGLGSGCSALFGSSALGGNPAWAAPIAEASKALPKTFGVVGDRMAQIYVSRNGKPIVDAGFGATPTGAAIRSDTLVPWASAVKPTTVAAVMRLVEAGRMGLDDPV